MSDEKKPPLTIACKISGFAFGIGVVYPGFEKNGWTWPPNNEGVFVAVLPLLVLNNELVFALVLPRSGVLFWGCKPENILEPCWLLVPKLKVDPPWVLFCELPKENALLF